jgi:hypothetical protein
VASGGVIGDSFVDNIPVMIGETKDMPITPDDFPNGR